MSVPQTDLAAYKIHLEEGEAPETAAAIRRGLYEFNLRYTTPDGYRPLVLSLRGAEGDLLGGLVGQTFWGWLHVELLWLEEGARGAGQGAALLTAAEAEAVRRGYRLFGQLDDFPPGHVHYFLRKDLPPA